MIYVNFYCADSDDNQGFINELVYGAKYEDENKFDETQIEDFESQIAKVVGHSVTIQGFYAHPTAKAAKDAIQADHGISIYITY